MKGACLALIGLGYLVAAISVVVNIRYGQRMSIDADGYWLQSAFLFALAISPAAISSVAGKLFGGGKWFRAILVFPIAPALLSVSVWNTMDFTADQMLGRVKLSEMKQKASKDAAEIQNSTILQDRKDLKDMLMRTFVTARKPEDKETSLKAMETFTEKPIALVAPSIEIAVADARASLAHKWFGWDREAVQGASVLAIPVIMALIELVFPMLGFAFWPGRREDHLKYRPPKGTVSGIPRKFSKAEARKDLLEMIRGNVLPMHGFALAERWGISPGLASKWLSDFGQEGIVIRKQSGVRKLVLPGPKALNGSGLHTA